MKVEPVVVVGQMRPVWVVVEDFLERAIDCQLVAARRWVVGVGHESRKRKKGSVRYRKVARRAGEQSVARDLLSSGRAFIQFSKKQKRGTPLGAGAVYKDRLREATEF